MTIYFITYTHTIPYFLCNLLSNVSNTFVIYFSSIIISHLKAVNVIHKSRHSIVELLGSIWWWFTWQGNPHQLDKTKYFCNSYALRYWCTTFRLWVTQHSSSWIASGMRNVKADTNTKVIFTGLFLSNTKCKCILYLEIYSKQKKRIISSKQWN